MASAHHGEHCDNSLFREKNIRVTDVEEVISSSTVLRKVLVLFDAGRSGKGKIIRKLKAFDCGFWDHCKYKVMADLFCRSQSPIVCRRGGQMAVIRYLLRLTIRAEKVWNLMLEMRPQIVYCHWQEEIEGKVGWFADNNT